MLDWQIRKALATGQIFNNISKKLGEGLGDTIGEDEIDNTLMEVHISRNNKGFDRRIFANTSKNPLCKLKQYVCVCI